MELAFQKISQELSTHVETQQTETQCELKKETSPKGASDCKWILFACEVPALLGLMKFLQPQQVFQNMKWRKQKGLKAESDIVVREICHKLSTTSLSNPMKANSHTSSNDVDLKNVDEDISEEDEEEMKFVKTEYEIPELNLVIKGQVHLTLSRNHTTVFICRNRKSKLSGRIWPEDVYLAQLYMLMLKDSYSNLRVNVKEFFGDDHYEEYIDMCDDFEHHAFSQLKPILKKLLQT